MSSSLLEAAFAHHIWATSRLIDSCLDLPVEDLETSVLGTRGPILETLRHLVLNDTFDLFVLTGDRAFDIDREQIVGRFERSVVVAVLHVWPEASEARDDGLP